MNRQHFEPHEIIVNETTEYFEMFSDSSPEFKRSVSKDTYEKNLDLEKEYRQYGRKHNMMASITNDAALNPLSESDMQPQAIIYPLVITLRKNGTSIIQDGSSVRESSVSVYVQSNSSLVTR